MLNNTNTYLHTLINAGADAYTNLYAVKFTGGYLTNVDEALTVRCESFTPPTFSHSTYDVKYVTATITRPAAKIDVTRNFTLSFRMDAYYDVYKALLKQMRLTFDPTKSYTATDILTLYNNGLLFSVDVETANTGVYTNTEIQSGTFYRFNGCWLTGITPPAYTTDTASAAKCTMNVSFLYMEDTQSGISGMTASPLTNVGLDGIA